MSKQPTRLHAVHDLCDGAARDIVRPETHAIGRGDDEYAIRVQLPAHLHPSRINRIYSVRGFVRPLPGARAG